MQEQKLIPISIFVSLLLYIYKTILLQEGGSFQGLKLGSCLTLGNKLSEETHVLTKRFYWERAPRWRTVG